MFLNDIILYAPFFLLNWVETGAQPKPGRSHQHLLPWMMQRAGQAPHHSHCRARENIVIMMIVQTMGSCWYLNMIFKLMHVFAGSSCCFHN